MKRNLLYVSSAFVVTALVAGLTMMNDKQEEVYTPRESNASIDAAYGAAEYRASMLVNASTGKLDLADVAQAKQQADDLLRKKKSSAIGLQWENEGPINIGGRTRAILLWNQDSNTVFAGSVSGGLFKSTNYGSSWEPVNDLQDNLSVVCLAQDKQGTIYYGTGETQYTGGSGTGNIGTPASLGGGVFKSTDGGNTFNVLASTIPTANNNSSQFAAIGKIAIDPNNDNTIYLGTNAGLRKSTDGGVTWTSPISLNSSCRDMIVTKTGIVWAKVGNRLYKSDNTGSNFTEISQAIPSSTEVPRTSWRMRMASSPEDDNYVYLVEIGVVTISSGSSQRTESNVLKKVYRTTDGGTTWATIGEYTALFNPHANQGNYNNAMAVDPINKDRLIMGGLPLYEWSTTGGWQQLSSNSADDQSPLYVHADNHEMQFDPNRPNILWVGNDGGIFRSTNSGRTWKSLNKGYTTTQYYHGQIDMNGATIGGTQDNGTIYVDNDQIIEGNGVRTNFMFFRGGLRDGDGGYALISKLDPTVWVKEMQQGISARSSDEGETFVEYFDFRRMFIGNTGNASDGSYANWVAPYVLWEKRFDELSEDSIALVADSAFTSIGFGNGGRTYTGTMRKAQASTLFKTDGLRIEAGPQLVTSDANGDLQGDGTGTFNPTTGEFTVTFTNGVLLEIIAKAATRYDAGSPILLTSKTGELPIFDTLDVALESNETYKSVDPAQSAFFIGHTGLNDNNSGLPNKNQRGGIWMTRELLSQKILTPTWHQIAEVGVGNTPTTMRVSDDGDNLWVGVSSGNTSGSRLMRITNINAARDSASMDLYDHYVFDTLQRPNTSVIESEYVRSFNQIITDIAVNPANPNEIVVTLANFGANQYVYRSVNALDPNPTFTPIQGDLPQMPVYTATFDINDPDGDNVILGTEYGIYTTDNFKQGLVSWTEENSGGARVPVYRLVQQRTVRYDLKTNQDFEGTIYAATHGRGFLKTNTTADYISIKENNTIVENTDIPVLEIYPNPASNFANFKVELENKEDVTLSIRDIRGALIRTLNYNNVSVGTSDLPINLNGLTSGTYLVSAQGGDFVRTAKLIVRN